MKFRLLSLISSILLLFALIPAQAQESGELFATRNGDIFAWDGNSTDQLTEWGFNGNPILSPDGRRIAYASVASEAVEVGGDPTQEQSYLVHLGTPVNNIWVMDTATRDFTRLVTQAGVFPMMRGEPAWSPTGDELAWVEYGVDQENYNVRARLVVYNFASGTTRDVAFVNLGFQDAGLRLPDIQWGAAGITYDIFTFVETGGAQIQLFLVNPSNQQVSQFVLYAAENPFSTGDIYPIDYVWVEHNTRAMIAILNNNKTWTLLDPVNGSQSQLLESPYLTPRNGTNARLVPDYVENNTQRGIAWTAVGTNGTQQGVGTGIGNTTRLGTLSIGVPAMSPDGSIVVYADEGGFNALNTNDSLAQINRFLAFTAERPYLNVNPQNAIWTPMRWVTSGNTGNPVPTPENPAPSIGSGACDLPVPFTVNDFITVQAGPPNNVRTNPTINAQYSASLHAGEVVTVVDGPVCADGFRWWQIAGEGGFTGWTAEGSSDGNSAWLLRLPQSPFLNQCSLDPRLARGSIGMVLEGDPNVIRNGPGVQATSVIGNIPAGGQFDVIGSSLCTMDGRRWYPIEYNGQYGWTAEGEGNTYWLAPLTF